MSQLTSSTGLTVNTEVEVVLVADMATEAALVIEVLATAAPQGMLEAEDTMEVTVKEESTEENLAKRSAIYVVNLVAGPPITARRSEIRAFSSF